MFRAAMNLRKRQPDHPRGYRSPALNLLCVLGMASSAAAILISFVPPSQFGGGSPVVFILIVGGGILLLGLVIPYLLIRLRKPTWQLGPSVSEEAS
jgi:glutamate:GABA antiporter